MKQFFKDKDILIGALILILICLCANWLGVWSWGNFLISFILIIFAKALRLMD